MADYLVCSGYFLYNNLIVMPATCKMHFQILVRKSYLTLICSESGRSFDHSF